MKLYIVRHGQTEWNVLGKMQGRTNIPLNEVGIEQAKLTKQILKDIHFDIAYSSSLDRAYETAKIIVEGRNIELKKMDILQEIALGPWEGEIGKVFGAINENVDNLFKHPDLFKPEEGVESVQDVLLRAKEAVKMIYQRHPRATVLLVAHGMFNRTLINYIEGNSLADHAKIRIQPSCSYEVAEIDDEGMRIISNQNTNIKECNNDKFEV